MQVKYIQTTVFQVMFITGNYRLPVILDCYLTGSYRQFGNYR